MTVVTPAVDLAIIGLFDDGRSKAAPRLTPGGANAVAQTLGPTADLSLQRQLILLVI
ncbi:hypothetical protein [Paraburkholderia sp. RAU2J]|uniref:hypothetical protein n=1 Tax=Paraburkholderia sp. RAU2J TaxID=1938810 RepID=UPI0013155A01|nr:hypothetical protein [Paraburkholderia sp. RAU2J]